MTARIAGCGPAPVTRRRPAPDTVFTGIGAEFAGRRTDTETNAMDTISPTTSRRHALIASLAVTLGFALAAALFVGAGQGTASTAGAEPMPTAAPMESVPTVGLPASAGIAASAAPSASGASIAAAATADAARAGEITDPVEDPQPDLILEAVDPAEALYGDLPPVASTN
jgi:hypothetical protein